MDAAAAPPLTALAGCRLFRPEGFAAGVEIVQAAPGERRGFPARISEGLGICLKTGPAHAVRSDGRERIYPDDAICVRQPGCVWSCESSRVGFLSIDLAPTLLPMDWRRRPMQFLPAQVLPDAAQAIRVVALSGSPLRRQEAVMQLLDALHQQGVLQAEGWRASDTDLAAVRRARDCLIAVPEADVSLDQLALAVGANKFVLLRQFRARYGATPHQYRLLLRLERARRRLVCGERVADVAQALGYADQAHFCRHFKRVLGLPPNDYRQLRLPVNFVQDDEVVTP
jgi:AraC-like DNA-binding protein